MDLLWPESSGALCVITIEQVQSEITGERYVEPFVTFSYEVLVEKSLGVDHE